MAERRGAGEMNVQRRTWDRDEYEKRAKERVEKEVSGEALKEDKAAPFRAAPAGLKGPEGSERAFLQSRTVDLGLESKLGKRRLVTEATPVSQVGGFFCEVCQCTLRDSATYLDHINGKNHQRRLGFTLRVERSTVDSVRDRLAHLRQAAGGAAAPRGAGAAKPVLDPEDRYAMAAMDHPSIQVVSGQRYATLAAAAAAAGDGGGGNDNELGKDGGEGGAGGDGDGPPQKRARGDGESDGGWRDGGAPEAAQARGGDGDDDADAMLAMGFGAFGSTKRSR